MFVLFVVDVPAHREKGENIYGVVNVTKGNESFVRQHIQKKAFQLKPYQIVCWLILFCAGVDVLILTWILCFAMTEWQIAVNCYLKVERRQTETWQNNQQRKKSGQKVNTDWQPHICYACSTGGNCTFTIKLKPVFSTSWWCFYYATSEFCVTVWVPFLFLAPVDPRVFTLLSGDRASAFTAANNKRSPGLALDKHILWSDTMASWLRVPPPWWEMFLNSYQSAENQMLCVFSELVDAENKSRALVLKPGEAEVKQRHSGGHFVCVTERRGDLSVTKEWSLGAFVENIIKRDLDMSVLNCGNELQHLTLLV